MDDDHRSHPSSFAPLSPRERDILALLAQDLSDQEIAERLVLAYTTVKWYNRQIFNKLGVDNRQQAVERGLHLGLLEQPDASIRVDHNLPTQLTPFIGRVREVSDLSRLLTLPGTRLVTILAPGGMGKTRLALASAELALRHFTDGVHFVPLAPLTSVDQLVPAMVEHLGLHNFQDNRPPKQQLLDFLRAKQALVVLDNFEHLLEGASLVTDILRAAPEVKVIATSRERLNLEEETVFTLTGMPYPQMSSSEDPLGYEAVRLFVDCAQRADARFVVQDSEPVVRVCQSVQGMPLALELAAVWVGKLSLDEITEEITRNTDFLSTTMRNLPERQRSVRGVFETTWRRLTDEERHVFRRLSVFRGGFTREAAEVVAEADLATLAALIDKALLWRASESGRYQIHEVLRQYAAEQLEAAGEANAVWSAYQDYYGRLADQWAKALKSTQLLQALDRLEGDIDNIREAFRRTIETGEPERIDPFIDLVFFYEIRGWCPEGEQVFGAAIERLNGRASVTLGRLLTAQAVISLGQVKTREARACAEKSLEILRHLGTEREIPTALIVLSASFGEFGDLEREARLLDEAFEIAQRYEDPWELCSLLFRRGLCAYRRKQMAEAKALVAQAYALSSNQGNLWVRNFALMQLAYIAFEVGDDDEAKRLYQECLISARNLRHSTAIGAALWGLSAIAIRQGQFSQARRFAEDRLKIERHAGRQDAMIYTLLSLVETAMAAHDDREARERLREALQLSNDPEQYSFLWVVFHSAKLFTQIGLGAEAVTLVSFLTQHPRAVREFPERDQVTLQALSTQLQAELPPNLYQAAWEQGRTLSLGDLLTKLRLVL